MILPRKYLNLELAPLRVAASILSLLKDEPVILLRDLQQAVESRVGPGARFSVKPALSLLFLLDILDYDVHADSVFRIQNRGDGE